MEFGIIKITGRNKGIIDLCSSILNFAKYTNSKETKTQIKTPFILKSFPSSSFGNGSLFHSSKKKPDQI